MNYRIVRFRPTDIDEILRIERLSFAGDAYTRRMFAYLVRLGPDTFFVAWTEQGILGYLAGFMDDDEGYIASIAVDPAVRRRGVARVLIETATHRFTAKGAVAIGLHVRPSNAAAVALYEGLGFALVARLPGYYKDEDGLFMRKPLI